MECLGRGVSFHNADLSAEERLAIESEFRRDDGQVQVICSTSTLAMGVNLPASVVVIPDTMKPDPDSEAFHEIPLTTSDYKNMAGRAGRTKFKEEGTSILVTNSPAEATKCWRNYVKGSLDVLKAPLAQDDLRKVMLSLFASGLCKSEQDCRELLLSSYTGYVHWNTSPLLREAFIKRVTENCVYLEKEGLILRQSKDGFSPTALGKLCAASGVEVETFVILLGVAKGLDPAHCEPWDIIFPCLHCRELDDILRIYIRSADPQSAWAKLDDLDPANRQTLSDWSQNLLKDGGNVTRRVQAFLILSDWIACVDTQEIENTYTLGGSNRILSGTIRTIAEITSWMVQTLSRIAIVLDHADGFVSWLRTLAERVARGVPAEGIELHKLGVPGVTRPVIKRMVDAKYGSLDTILETPAPRFKGIIRPGLAQRIHEAIIAQLRELQDRSKHIQSSRLEKHGMDTQVINEIYELEGIPLEDAVANLLNAPPLSLRAERITKQKKGEPDIRIALPEGIVVGSVTASASNVSDSKCAEIIRSGARFNPTAFAVFGRPRFHELAISNAPNLNNQLDQSKSYKLIPIHELGELFVRVVEGTLSRKQFIDILMNRKRLELAVLTGDR